MDTHVLYQHIKCVDTAIMPIKIKKTICGIKAQIKWFNVTNPDNPFYLGLTETIFIKEDQINNWLRWSKNAKKQ